ncbi:MAG: xanthine dehydrogenase family protein subunit M [Betaproteobacteria bacterium]|nr:MAG: xanthine dehydrogenase family protein subunit M [Betaproteobacteria bacterium]
MKPASFAYHRPRSLGEALALLAEHGAEAKPLAGGQSLGPMMNMRLAQPARLIDLNAIKGLDFLNETENAVEIGALTRHQTIASSSLVRAACPLLAEAAQSIGHYAIRARGTLGGSLAHADPAAQLPLVAATLGAEIAVAGPRGERRIAAQDFFVSLMTTVLEPDELIVSVGFPKAAPREAHAFVQFSRRRGDFAMAAVAVSVLLDVQKRIQRLRLGIGGVEDKPVVPTRLIEQSEGKVPEPAALAAAAREAVSPAENPRVPAVYRRELVEVLTRRALQKCLNSN